MSRRLGSLQAAENQVEDENRAQGVVAPLRPTAILRNIINERLEEPIKLSYEKVKFIRHFSLALHAS